MDRYDLIIIGGGAAGFAAGLYSARYQMKTLIVGEVFGGETATGGLIENYPGYVGIDGGELMLHMREQVERYGVKVLDELVEEISREVDCFEVSVGGDTYQGSAVVLAVGRERRKLGLPHKEEWTGKWVSFCATCDAPLYKGKIAGVVGGGDAAAKGAVLLGKYATNVYIIYRGKAFTRLEPANLQMLRDSPNVEQLLEANVVALKGSEEDLNGVMLDHYFNSSRELSLDGLFLELGADPRVELARSLGVDLNQKNRN